MAATDLAPPGGEPPLFPLTKEIAANLLGKRLRLWNDTRNTQPVPIYQGFEHWHEWERIQPGPLKIPGTGIAEPPGCDGDYEENRVEIPAAAWRCLNTQTALDEAARTLVDPDSGWINLSPLHDNSILLQPTPSTDRHLTAGAAALHCSK